MKYYVGDTETTTEEYSNDETKVWAWASCEIGHETELEYGSNIDSLMAEMFDKQGTWFFHNLKWDGGFILPWLFKKGFTFNPNKKNKTHTFKATISKTGQWYSIDICLSRQGKHVNHVTILDSWKKLPFKVADIAKAFDLEERKTSIDYDLNPDNINWLDDPKAKEYVSNDVIIVSKALQIQFNEGMKRMTIGSDSLADFKDYIGKHQYEQLFPVLPEIVHQDMRGAYKGGFVWANPRFAGKDIGKGRVYDTNSMYPSRMRKCLLPYGMPTTFEGQYQQDDRKPLYIQRIRCMFDLKEGHVPTVQLKNVGRFGTTEYLTTSNGEEIEMQLASPDLDLLMKHYRVYNIEYKGGYKFAGKHGIFDGWIDKYMEVKMHATGAIRQLAKLRLNNLYGKFGSNLDVTRKEPYLDENGVLRFKEMDRETGKDKYLPMGIFITAWARHYIISTAQRCYDRILYCDTDSIHLKGDSIPHAIADDIDPVKLGYWKHESTFNRGRFLRPKTYIEDIDGDENFYPKDTVVSYPLTAEHNKIVVDHVFNGKKLEGYIISDYTQDEDGKNVPTGITQQVGANEISHIHIVCAGMQPKTRKKITWSNFHIGFVDPDGKTRPKNIKGGTVLTTGPYQLRK